MTKEQPWAWCKTDVNGRPTQILERGEAEAAMENGFLLTPLYRGASPRDAARLREIEHLAWHLMDDSAEDATTGEITIHPMREDYEKLSALLPADHPGDDEHSGDKNAEQKG